MDIVPPIKLVPDREDEPNLPPAPPNEVVVPEQESERQNRLKRSTRIIRPPERLRDYECH